MSYQYEGQFYFKTPRESTALRKSGTTLLLLFNIDDDDSDYYTVK